jgi:hypothetical protein
VLFARQALGVKQTWSRQEELLRALVKHRMVAVRAGQKVSKTYSIAAIALWWIATRLLGKVIIVSSTETQIEGIVWPELRRCSQEAPMPLGGKLYDSIRKGWRFFKPTERSIIGLVTKKPENMQGFGGPEVLFIVDEASGVPDELFAPMEGNMAADECAMILFSNPTQNVGYYYDAFHSKAELWHPIHISSEESPNIVEGRTVIPGLAGRLWLARQKKNWGEDSDMYEIRVRGNFATKGANSIISVHQVLEAEKRWDAAKEEGPLVIGVDPAGGGPDDQVAFPRRGLKALRPGVWHNLEKEALADAVLALAIELRRPNEQVIFNIDDLGLGAGVAHILEAHHLDWVKVVRVNVSAPSEADEETQGRLANRKTDAWTATRDWFLAGGAIPAIPKMQAELVAPRWVERGGKLYVEDKRSVRSRIGRSPDLADALVLSVYEPKPVEPADYNSVPKIHSGRRW